MRHRLPPFEPDPVIDAYKKDVDQTLLIENLKLTPAERLQRIQDMIDFMEQVRGAARNAKPAEAAAGK
jgi:hypothetical protein